VPFAFFLSLAPQEGFRYIAAPQAAAVAGAGTSGYAHRGRPGRTEAVTGVRPDPFRSQKKDRTWLCTSIS
jgi:hypothetical protein